MSKAWPRLSQGALRSFLATLLFVFSFASCSDSGTNGASDGSCTPGETKACTCDDGLESTRTCEAGGTSYAECQCSIVADVAEPQDIPGESADGDKSDVPPKDSDDPCKTDCSGKVCGDDGCGGVCGICEWGACVAGACSCEPDCEGKVCGPDGCGGSCGECANDTHCGVYGSCESVNSCEEMAGSYCCADDKVWTCVDGAFDLYEDCSTSGASCGLIADWDWVDVDCGSFEELLPLDDPSVTTAPGCPGCVPQCAGKDCGTDGCGGLCAECPQGKTCDVSSSTCVDCVPECEGLDCGDDGCGGSCGSCPGEAACSSGLCVSGAWTCLETYYGSDDGCDCECGAYDPDCDDPEAKLYGCATGESCSSDGTCEPCVPSCDGKECGNDGCGGDCAACPVGKKCDQPSFTCVDCVPECEGLVCGDDGCGGSCGSCPGGSTCSSNLCVPDAWTCLGSYYGSADGCDCGCGAYDPDCDDPSANLYGCGYGESCSSDGTCEPCVPSCDGKHCGDDGCGGDCGTCAEDQYCALETFSCQHDPCADMDSSDCCMGNQWHKCETGVGPVLYDDCGEDGNVCGISLYYGDPELRCGALEDWISPLVADPPYKVACPACVPSCPDTECGHDGCGGQCGSCPAGKACDLATGTCGACEPDCSWKVCGSDGCGGSCGTCSEGGCILGVCAPTGWTCDPTYYKADDGCDCECGAYDPDCDDPYASLYGCETGEVCSTEGTCKPCEPDCSGKACGDDGCDGSCGDCPEGEYCNPLDFACEPDPCDEIPEGRCCMNNQLYGCGYGGGLSLYSNCEAWGEVCGFKDSYGYVNLTCGSPEEWLSQEEAGVDYKAACPGCVPDCTGAQCGGDGCGGLCGVCAAGTTCDLSNGACSP